MKDQSLRIINGAKNSHKRFDYEDDVIFVPGAQQLKSAESSSIARDDVDKPKKRKRKHEGKDKPINKMKPNAAELLVHDVFDQVSSEDCANSKKVKKKHKKKNIDDKELDFVNDEEEKAREECTEKDRSSSEVNHICSEAITLKKKKKKYKDFDDSDFNGVHKHKKKKIKEPVFLGVDEVNEEYDNSENSMKNTVYVKHCDSNNSVQKRRKIDDIVHSTIESVADQVVKQQKDAQNTRSSDIERKHKKKKNIEDKELNFVNDEEEKARKERTDKHSSSSEVNHNCSKAITLKKKKKKHKYFDDSDFNGVHKHKKRNIKEEPGFLGVDEVNKEYDNSESSMKNTVYVKHCDSNNSVQKRRRIDDIVNSTIESVAGQVVKQQKDAQNSSSSDTENKKKKSKESDTLVLSPKPEIHIKDCSSDEDELDISYSNNRFQNIVKLTKHDLPPYNINFEVPTLHKILNRVAKPTLTQRALVCEEGLQVKFGKFTKDEDKQIRENWTNLIQSNNLEDKPEVFFCLDNKHITNDAKRTFLYYLARNMPERTPYSVFKRFKILMGQTKKGRFTKEENEFITKMIIENKGRRHLSEVAQYLQRPYDSIDKRIGVMERSHTRKIKWKRKENAQAFIKNLLRVTKTPEENIQDLKNRHISSTEWEKLSRKLDNVPSRILKRSWLEILHPALFLPSDCYDLGKVKLKLIKMFYDNKETEWRKVNWSYYASQFDGFTHLRLYSLMQSMVLVHVPASKRQNLKKCLKVLIRLKQEDIRPHLVYKIKYKNGEVFVLSPREITHE